MGAQFKLISKSDNINDRMESDIRYIMENMDDRKDSDFIATTFQKKYGGSWIMIVHKRDNDCSFNMSFAFKSLKWIKFERGYSKYYLFQISE